jgi:ATP-binding cassette subfamily B protein
MTDQQEKLKFRKMIGLLGYGYKLAAKMTPSFIPLMLLRALITAAQPLLVLFFSARILNELDGPQNVQTIILYVSITVGATFLLSVSRAFLTRGVETVSSYWIVYQNLKMMQAERFTEMDFAHTEENNISEVLARMDTQARGNGLGLINVYQLSAQAAEGFFSLIFAGLLLFGPLAAGAGLSGWPVWALYGFFILGILFGLRLQLHSQVILKRIYSENAKSNTAAGFYHNYVKADQAAKDIRLYDQSAALLTIFKSSFNLKTWLPFFFFGGRVQGFTLGLLAVLGGGYYLLAGYGALDGTVTVGGIVQSVGAVTAFATAVGTLIMMFGELINNASFLKPMREFLSLPDLLAKGDKPVPPPEGYCYEFEFRNVSFRYPGAEGYALKGLNMKFNAGQRLAVVGPNGSGKTTMIKLLCRLYDPTEGEILLDGADIREYDYAQFTALFSVVFQDFHLFPLQLGSNVAAGESYDAVRVNAMLEGAGFTERLSSMPDGLDTVLYKSYDEDGTQISGGEAQKIALARALYRDAPFVILDEPTAALDPIAEYEVYSTFEQTIGGKTAVFISHRLSSCRFCHDIAVFDGGRLVQRGGHEALLTDEDGLYRKLWDAQAQHYVD